MLKIKIAGIEFTPAAEAVILEAMCGGSNRAALAADQILGDVDALRSGEHSRDSLLAHYLDGADEDRVQGWNDYVDAVCAAAGYVEIETMPDWLRESHRAAGGFGRYPANGAERRIVHPDEAEAIVEADGDGYDHIVR